MFMFTKEPEILENSEYKRTLEKNDHVLLKLRPKGIPQETRNYDYKDGKYKYSEVNFVE